MTGSEHYAWSIFAIIAMFWWAGVESTNVRLCYCWQCYISCKVRKFTTEIYPYLSNIWFLWVCTLSNAIYFHVLKKQVPDKNIHFQFIFMSDHVLFCSIIVSSLKWSKIRPNLPWLVDSGGCVLLDTFVSSLHVYTRVFIFLIYDYIIFYSGIVCNPSWT